MGRLRLRGLGCKHFLAEVCEQGSVTDLVDISPFHVGIAKPELNDSLRANELPAIIATSRTERQTALCRPL